MIRYKGHGNASFWKNDNLLTNISGIMAIGVALFPMNADVFATKIYTLIPYAEKWLGWLHYAFAALLFLIMALLSINVFTIGQENETRDPKSILNENNIYRFCGYSIIVFVILVPISETFKWFRYSSLILEALALFAFGIAWLIKGRALGDSGEIGKKLYQENNPVDTEKVFEE
jgi:cellulose synthase/poly-beta-1,6-N-acetylglucosamine synthase-like glycosyltransferase